MEMSKNLQGSACLRFEGRSGPPTGTKKLLTMRGSSASTEVNGHWVDPITVDYNKFDVARFASRTATVGQMSQLDPEPYGL